jgi:hypothetical protein
MSRAQGKNNYKISDVHQGRRDEGDEEGRLASAGKKAA